MTNLSTTYMGLKLKNPIIVGSSGLTKSVSNIIELEKNGAGAVVLKSLFEEQIRYEVHKTITQSQSSYTYPEAEDLISNYSKHHDIEEYLKLIKESKKAVKIPIIASINCTSAEEWTSFAKKIQEAGADGIELNIFILPSDPNHSGEENEKVYFDIISKIQQQVTIPIAVKISYYFSGLSRMILKLSWSKISGLVLFNRFFSPDIDIDNFKVVATNIYSTPEELSISLRWVAMLSDKTTCDIAASTGIYDGKSIIKQLLAGAKAVQVCSTLYQNGFGQINIMLKELEDWMTKHKFNSIEDFRGKMSYKHAENPAAYERVQFMKHVAGIE